jgi:hypothetical protein
LALAADQRFVKLGRHPKTWIIVGLLLSATVKGIMKPRHARRSRFDSFGSAENGLRVV